jgi:hypothetical protein
MAAPMAAAASPFELQPVEPAVGRTVARLTALQPSTPTAPTSLQSPPSFTRSCPAPTTARAATRREGGHTGRVQRLFGFIGGASAGQPTGVALLAQGTWRLPAPAGPWARAHPAGQTPCASVLLRGMYSGVPSFYNVFCNLLGKPMIIGEVRSTRLGLLPARGLPGGLPRRAGSCFTLAQPLLVAVDAGSCARGAAHCRSLAHD